MNINGKRKAVEGKERSAKICRTDSNSSLERKVNLSVNADCPIVNQMSSFHDKCSFIGYRDEDKKEKDNPPRKDKTCIKNKEKKAQKHKMKSKMEIATSKEKEDIVSNKKIKDVKENNVDRPLKLNEAWSKSNKKKQQIKTLGDHEKHNKPLGDHEKHKNDKNKKRKIKLKNKGGEEKIITKGLEMDFRETINKEKVIKKE